MATKKTSSGGASKTTAKLASPGKKTVSAPSGKKSAAAKSATGKAAAKGVKSLELGTLSAKRVAAGAAKPAIAPSSGKLVRVELKLTPQQRADLEKATGKKVKSLRLTVQDLADLANVILN